MEVKTEELGLGVGRRETSRLKTANREAAAAGPEETLAKAGEPAAKVDGHLGMIAAAIDSEDRIKSDLRDRSEAHAQALLTASQILTQPNQARSAQANLAPQSALVLLRD